jgi:hypothetical protein
MIGKVAASIKPLQRRTNAVREPGNLRLCDARTAGEKAKSR